MPFRNVLFILNLLSCLFLLMDFYALQIVLEHMSEEQKRPLKLFSKNGNDSNNDDNNNDNNNSNN